MPTWNQRTAHESHLICVEMESFNALLLKSVNALPLQLLNLTDCASVTVPLPCRMMITHSHKSLSLSLACPYPRTPPSFLLHSRDAYLASLGPTLAVGTAAVWCVALLPPFSPSFYLHSCSQHTVPLPHNIPNHCISLYCCHAHPGSAPSSHPSLAGIGPLCFLSLPQEPMSILDKLS